MHHGNNETNEILYIKNFSDKLVQKTISKAAINNQSQWIECLVITITMKAHYVYGHRQSEKIG